MDRAETAGAMTRVEADLTATPAPGAVMPVAAGRVLAVTDPCVVVMTDATVRPQVGAMTAAHVAPAVRTVATRAVPRVVAPSVTVSSGVDHVSPPSRRDVRSRVSLTG